MESKPNCGFLKTGRDLNVFKCYWVDRNRKGEFVVRDRDESLRWFYKSRRKMMD